MLHRRVLCGEVWYRDMSLDVLVVCGLVGCDLVWCGWMYSCHVVRWGMVWCTREMWYDDLVSCDEMRYDVVYVVWCDVVYVVWCDVVYSWGMIWCDVVWCGLLVRYGMMWCTCEVCVMGWDVLVSYGEMRYVVWCDLVWCMSFLNDIIWFRLMNNR